MLLYFPSKTTAVSPFLPPLFLPSSLPVSLHLHSLRFSGYLFLPPSQFPPFSLLPSHHHLSPGFLYCSSILPEPRFEPLTSISHRAAKECNILNRKLDHTTQSPTLVTLPWLPIAFRRKFEFLIKVYKALNIWSWLNFSTLSIFPLFNFSPSTRACFLQF